jgi:hypothetical protein
MGMISHGRYCINLTANRLSLCDCAGKIFILITIIYFFLFATFNPPYIHTYHKFTNDLHFYAILHDSVLTIF